MPNVKLILEFDGTNYFGWQIQPKLPTIQGTLKEALFKLTNEEVKIIGCGRTDAGVHARNFVANFWTNARILPEDLHRALNGLLPQDIRVKRLSVVADTFHARRDAVSKAYLYQIFTGKVLSPFLYRYFFHFPVPLDFSLMSAAARAFVGCHDFAAFSGSKSEVKTTVRTVLASTLVRRGYKLYYHIEANGFLYHMVRNIVGTILDIGQGKIPLEDLSDIFASGDRRLAGFAAPACGLFFLKAKYLKPSTDE